MPYTHKEIQESKEQVREGFRDAQERGLTLQQAKDDLIKTIQQMTGKQLGLFINAVNEVFKELSTQYKLW